MLEHLNKDTFTQKVFDFENNTDWKFEGELPCIIDFYAGWCGPCKTIAPILEELAEEYSGKINIYKIDTEEEQELSMAFNVRSIPAVLFIPLNEKPQMSVGAMPKTDFVKAIENVLLKNN